MKLVSLTLIHNYYNIMQLVFTCSMIMLSFFFLLDQITMGSHLPTPHPTMMHPVPTRWPAVLTPMSAAVPSHAQVPTLRHTCHPRLPLTPWPPWLQLGFHYLPSQPSHSLPPLHYTSPPIWITTRRIYTPLHFHSLTSILQFLKRECGPNRSIWLGSASLVLSHRTLQQ